MLFIPSILSALLNWFSFWPPGSLPWGRTGGEEIDLGGTVPVSPELETGPCATLISIQTLRVETDQVTMVLPSQCPLKSFSCLLSTNIGMGTWVIQLVKRLPLAQVMILASWDGPLAQAPYSAGSLLLTLPLPVPLLVLILSLSLTLSFSLSLFRINRE